MVLKGVSFAIAPGTLIVGENGVDKSSVLRILVGDVRPSHGKVLHSGVMGDCPRQVILNEALHCGEATNAPGQQVVLQLRTPLRLQCDHGCGSHDGGQPAIFFCSSFFALLLASKIVLPSRNGGLLCRGRTRHLREMGTNPRPYRSKANQAISSPLFWNGLLVEAPFCVTLLASHNRPFCETN